MFQFTPPEYLKSHIFLLLQILNALERLGYRVVTSSSVVTGFGKHDTKWVLTIIIVGPLYFIVKRQKYQTKTKKSFIL